MTRSTVSALVLFALSSCATAGTTATEQAAPRRTITTVTNTNAAGQTTTTALTTYTTAAAPATIQAVPAAVFAVLGEVYSAIGIEVGTVDAPTRTMGNTQFRATRRLRNEPLSRYVDCGGNSMGASLANTRPVRISILSTVTPQGTSSQLRTVVEASTTTAEQSGGIPCTSTGELEASIARMVALRLAAR